jgi:transcription elongation factor GreA
MAETHLSRPAYERLQSEFQELTTAGRVRIAQHIETARALGDLSENGDYHAAKNEQALMEARIRQLNQILETAQIVEDDVVVGDEVVPGAVVTLRFDGDDAEERYLVGSIEERRDDVTTVSPGAPLGKALLGRRQGDTISYELPNGSTMGVEIVKVGT